MSVAKFMLVALPVLACTGAVRNTDSARLPEITVHDESGIVLVMVNDKRGSFHISRHEVTRAQWVHVMGSVPRPPLTNDFWLPDEPMTDVTWNEALEFAKRVSLRLPTEDEWERACIGGSDRDPYGDLLEISASRITVVGTKQPNDLGVYDMIGNAVEWTGTTEAGKRVIKGDNDARWRNLLEPGVHFRRCGFRVARDP